VTDPKVNEDTPDNNENPPDEEGEEEELNVDAPSPEDTPNPKEPWQRTEIMKNSLEMLTKLFPTKKPSVLELVLKRCGDDLIKAIEEIVPKTAGRFEGFDDSKKTQFEKLRATIEEANEKSAFKPVGPRFNSTQEVFLPFSPSISTALFALSTPSLNIGCSLGNFPMPPTFHLPGNHFNMVSHLPTCPSDLLFHVPGSSRDVHVVGNLHRVKDVLYPTDLSHHRMDHK